MIRKMICFLLIMPLCCFAGWKPHPKKNIELIVVNRHGEKPAASLGQLNCMGLNRALALPNYYEKNFPKPDFIYAPAPSQQDYHGASMFSYVRPLATIEPTAIRLSMPVNAQIGMSAIYFLTHAVLLPSHHSSVTYITWEHHNIIRLADLILNKFHVTPKKKVTWAENDFNKVLAFKIDWNKSKPKLTFYTTSENMHNLSKICPGQ